MAGMNKMRALNRLPYDFEDGLKIGGVDVTTLNQMSTANGAGLIGFTPVGNLGSTTVQAAIAELDVEKVDNAALAASAGSSLVGYDGSTVQAVLDSAKPMADYTALRAYTGRATSVRITSNGLAGFFYRDDADTTGVDNGGTVIVSGNGKRWKRLYEGAVNVKWFGAKGDWNGTTGTDDTLAVKAAVQNSKDLWFPTGNYLISSTVRSDKVISVMGDPGATLVAATGFTGLSITKGGLPFVLKSLLAVFSGNDVGSITNPRLSDETKVVTIGKLSFNCQNNCDYGIFLNATPNAVVDANVRYAADTGIYVGNLSWNVTLNSNKITGCANIGIYVGQACNGVTINTPYVLGTPTVIPNIGIMIEGAPAGTSTSVGFATGNVSIKGGTIEDCYIGLYTLGAVSVYVSSNIEGIVRRSDLSEGHAVYANATATTARTAANIILDGCNLASEGNSIKNNNAKILVRNCLIPNGYTLDPFLSLTNYSIFNTVDNYYYSGTSEANEPALTGAKSIWYHHDTVSTTEVRNKKIVTITGTYQPVYRQWTLSSNDQPSERSAILEIHTKKIDDVDKAYYSQFRLSAHITDSFGGTPRIKSATGLYIGFADDQSKEIRPSSDVDTNLGSSTFKWKGVYSSSVATGSLSLGVRTSTSTNTNPLPNDYTILIDATGGARYFYLPLCADNPGRVFIVKKIDSSANGVDVVAQSAETIEGIRTRTLSTQYQMIRLQSNGVAWFII